MNSVEIAKISEICELLCKAWSYNPEYTLPEIFRGVFPPMVADLSDKDTVIAVLKDYCAGVAIEAVKVGKIYQTNQVTNPTTEN